MKAKIVGTNIEVTPAMKKAIESSLKKLDKFECFSDNTPCVVTVRTVKEDQIIEVSIFLSNKKIIRCERRADSLYDAINMAEKTLSRILRKEKEKMEQRKGIKTIHSEDIFDVPEK